MLQLSGEDIAELKMRHLKYLAMYHRRLRHFVCLVLLALFIKNHSNVCRSREVQLCDVLSELLEGFLIKQSDSAGHEQPEDHQELFFQRQRHRE